MILAEFLPKHDLGRLNQQLGDTSERSLKVWFSEVLIEERFAGPVLMKHERTRRTGLLVQIVIDTPGITPTGFNQGKQFVAHGGLLPGAGFHKSCDSNVLIHTVSMRTNGFRGKPRLSS